MIGVKKMEKTLILLKPDTVAKGICGEIISRFERRGFKMVGTKMLHLSREQAEMHYDEHREKPFFEELVTFIISGPLIAIALSGENVIKLSRAMMGFTNPLEAAVGTIRADFATNVRQNIVHGSDSFESAQRELKMFFAEGEIHETDYKMPWEDL